MNDAKEVIQEFRSFIEASFPESSSKTGFECVPSSEDTPKLDIRFRVSWHTQDDPTRPSKRSRPIILEIPCDYLINNGQSNLAKIQIQLASFIEKHRKQFYQNPANFSGNTDSYDEWIFED